MPVDKMLLGNRETRSRITGGKGIYEKHSSGSNFDAFRRDP